MRLQPAIELIFILGVLLACGGKAPNPPAPSASTAKAVQVPLAPFLLSLQEIAANPKAFHPTRNEVDEKTRGSSYDFKIPGLPGDLETPELHVAPGRPSAWKWIVCGSPAVEYYGSLAAVSGYKLGTEQRLNAISSGPLSGDFLLSTTHDRGCYGVMSADWLGLYGIN